MSADFHAERGQVYWSCSPTGGPRIRVTEVDADHARIVDARTRKRPRRILLTELHPTPVTLFGKRRRTGYALDPSEVDAGPVTDHMQRIVAARPHLPVTAIADRARVPASTLKSLLADAKAGRQRALNVETAHRLLLLSASDLPHETKGMGGRSTDAAPAMGHLRDLMAAHSETSVAEFARAVSMHPSTMAAALGDYAAGRPRAIKAVAAERILALGTTITVPLAAARRRDVVDAAPVVEHVRGFQRRYELASTAFIAQTAGVNVSTLISVLTEFEADPRRGIRPDVARKVLAVEHLPPPAFPRKSGVSDTGLIRRVRALCAVGWRLREIADAGGTTVKSLGELLTTGTATPTIRGAVLTAWDALAARVGPSAHARHRARVKQWDPPFAWDEETIDDPGTQPCGTRSAGRSVEWDPQTLRSEICFLTRLGLNWTQSLERLGLGSGRAHELLAEAESDAAGTCPQPPLPSSEDPSHALAA
ncbi:hypothetical protein [Streptomyces sp. NPDC054865]